MPINILLVDDDYSKSAMIIARLKESCPHSMTFKTAETYETAVSEMTSNVKYDIIAFDCNLGAKWSGKDLQYFHRQYNPKCLSVLYTAFPQKLDAIDSCVPYECLLEVLVNYIECIAITKNHSSNNDNLGGGMELEHSCKHEATIVDVNSKIDRISDALLGTLENEGHGLVSDVKTLVIAMMEIKNWKQIVEEKERRLPWRIVTFAGGVSVGIGGLMWGLVLHFAK